MNNIFYKIFNIADVDGRFLDATLPIALFNGSSPDQDMMFLIVYIYIYIYPVTSLVYPLTSRIYTTI